jgi:hypothetical protein
VSKEAARLDAWEKGIAPSDELRRWYGHDRQKWTEFQARYEHGARSALTRADIGVTMGGETDMAMAVADITLWAGPARPCPCPRVGRGD